MVEQACATRLPRAGGPSSCATNRPLDGLPLVVGLGCCTNGQGRLPVGFRLGRPKRAGAAHTARPNLPVAAEVVRPVGRARRPVAALGFDTHATAGWVTNHRQRLDRRAPAVIVDAPKDGQRRVGVTSNGHGHQDSLGSNARPAERLTLVRRTRSRWAVETVCRDRQPFAGWDACHGWGEQARGRQGALVLLTFVVYQLVRRAPDQAVGAVKQRSHLAVGHAGERPLPLRATADGLAVNADTPLLTGTAAPAWWGRGE